MRLFLLLFLVTLIERPALAQEKPKTAAERVNQTQKQLNSLDTISKRKADSLKNLANKPQERVNGVARDTEGRIAQPIDSLQNKLGNTAQSIQSKTTEPVRQQLTNLGEKISNPTDSVQKKLNGTAQSIQNKTIDPLQQSAKSVADKLTNPADSLARKLDGGIESVQGTIRSQMDSMQRALNFTSPTVPADLNMPGTNLNIPGTSPTLPGATTVIPSTTSPNLALPGMEKPATGLPATSLPATSLPATNLPATSLPATSLPDLKVQQGITVPKVDELPGVKDINQLNSEVDKAGGQLKQVGEIHGEIKNLNQGNLDEVKALPKGAEDEALKMAEANRLKAEADKFRMPHEQYKALIEKYKDKKRLQQEMEQKSAAVANELIAQHAPAINDAQQRMSRAKRIYGNVQSLKDLPKKRPNEMKGKPFRERIVPGLNLQIYQSDKVLIDFAPSAGYRLTSRWTVGAAYTFRLGFSDANPNFVSNEHVHGPRAFGQFMVTKGFYLHADLEALQTQRVDPNVSEVLSESVFASYIGIGRGFTITRKIRGSVAGLYRYEFSGTLPGQSPFNLRIGFTFVTKKFPKITGPVTVK